MHTSPKFFISNQHLQQIVDHARADYPYEACGLAGGLDDCVETVIPIPNASLTPQTSFEMERQAMVDSIISLQQSGQDVVAIYHSHPGEPAIPSATDIAQATWPDAVYVIVGLVDLDTPDVRAWLIRSMQVEPVTILTFD